MTEPLLLALTTLGVAMADRSRPRPAGAAQVAPDRLRARPGVPDRVTKRGRSLQRRSVLAAWALVRKGLPRRDAAREVATIAAYPAAAIVLFLIFSRVVIGQWFVANGFFIPENKAQGDLWLVIEEIAWGVEALSASWLVWLGAIGPAVAAGVSLGRRPEALVVARADGNRGDAAGGVLRGPPVPDSLHGSAARRGGGRRRHRGGSLAT